MDKEVKLKLREIFPSLQMPHWALAFLYEEPDCISELWSEHRSRYADRIPHLDPIALQELCKWLSKGNKAPEVAGLISENLPCMYLEDLEIGKSNPRISKMRDEIESIRQASFDLRRALTQASEITMLQMEWIFFLPWPKGKTKAEMMPIWEKEDNSKQSKYRAKLCKHVFSTDETMEHGFPNPDFINILSELERTAMQMINLTPKDKGGPVSGYHDAEGKRAKEYLVLSSRGILREFGLPNGSQKNGPISRFITLVHKCATGNEAPWADKYASMAPTLEKLDREGISPR